MALEPKKAFCLVMKDRIRQLMESQHMTQQTFSDFIGISSASLSSIFTGRTKPTLNTVEAIRSKFTKINLDWLMYGQGPMFKDQVTESGLMVVRTEWLVLPLLKVILISLQPLPHPSRVMGKVPHSMLMIH